MSDIQIQLPWERMTPQMRNHLICDLISAEKLGQYYVFIDGRQFLPLPCDKSEPVKATQMEKALLGPSWREFSAQHGIPDELRNKVEVLLVEWPLRYSDTPGGGWEVIEAIRAKGFEVTIVNERKGWTVAVSLQGVSGSEYFSNAPTMAEAACLVARQCIKPAPLTPEQVAELARAQSDQVPIYVIYDHPDDYPEYFVIRKWLGMTPTDDSALWNSLEEARNNLPPGLTKMDRFENDDPKIVEVWF